MTLRAAFHTWTTTRLVAGVVFLCATLMIGVVTDVATDRVTPSMSAAGTEVSSTATDASHPKMAMAEHVGSHAEVTSPCDRPCDPERCAPDHCAAACASAGVGVAGSVPSFAFHGTSARSTDRRDVVPLVAAAPSPPYRPPIA